MIFVLNGIGGSGKDTLVEQTIRSGLFKEVHNFSNSIFAKKIMQEHFGWDGKKKGDLERKILADLIDLGNMYGDLPFLQLKKKCEDFNKPGVVVFAHIRQTDQIAKMSDIFGNRVKTILVTRYKLDGRKFRPQSDEQLPYTDTYEYIENYKYDLYLNNIEGNRDNMFYEFIQEATALVNQEFLEYSENKIDYDFSNFKWTA